MNSDHMVSRIENELGLTQRRERSEPIYASAPRIPGYELMRVIGVGSYGNVWLARGVTGALRAVKVVHRHRFTSDRPYEREFRGIVKFEPISRSHPGVVSVLHVGKDDEPACFYYVMELADSAAEVDLGAGYPGHVSPPDVQAYDPRTLASELRSRKRLPVSEVLTLGVQLADALGHLHRHSLVHRDVKPSNVIYVGGAPKLADVGLITATDEARTFVGTEGFIPPEGPGSERADLFGLGRLLYEAATGKDRCDFPELPGDLKTWPQRTLLLELNEVLVRACAPDPRQRHPNAAAFAADLNLLLSGGSVRRTYDIERRLRFATRLAAIAGLVTFVAVGVIGLSEFQRDRADQRAARESSLRSRAEQAELAGRDRLREALLQQARALIGGNEPDRRTKALTALKQAAEIEPGLDLRNAAIAALTTPELRVIRRFHASPDGRGGERPDPQFQRYARCQPDGSVTIHSLADDQELLRLPRVRVRADYGIFSPDGLWLGVKYGDRQFRLWNLVARTNLTCSDDMSELAAAFTPNGTYLAVGETSGRLRLLDVKTGRERFRRELGYAPYQLAMHPREPVLACIGAEQSRLQVIRWPEGEILLEAPLPPTGLAIAWSADGRHLFTSHADHSVQVWNWPDFSTPRLILRHHRSEPIHLLTDPSGRWLMTAGWDSVTALFDLKDGSRVLSRTAGILAASTDQPAFLLGNSGVFDVVELDRPYGMTSIPVHAVGKTPHTLAFSPDGRWIATCGEDGVRLCDWRVGRVEVVTADERVCRVSFSADSRLLRAVSSDRLRTWSVEADPETGWPRFEGVAIAAGGKREFAGLGSTEAAISEHGELWLAAASARAGAASAWVTGRFDDDDQERLEGLTPGATSPHLSADGRWVAWGTWQLNDAFVMDRNDPGKPVRFPVRGSTAVKFSPDSRLLVVGGPEEVQCFEAGTWKLLHTIPRVPAANPPPKFAFASDSRLCAVAQPPDLVVLLDVISGDEIARLPAAGHFLSEPAFSPDNQTLAVACTDHQVLIWEIGKARTELAKLGLDW